MKLNMKNILLLITIVLLALITLAKLDCGSKPTPSGSEIKTDTVFVVDTLFVKKNIYIDKLKATIDTIFIDSNEVLFAEADTLIKADSTKINVKYFFPPANYFEIDFDIKEKIITNTIEILKTETIIEELSLFENTWFYVSGFLAMILILITT